ncbi:DUF6266 family protein [Aequorivita capsosiphonis]|uniref:DUF6266 family protein n=1 Tax=Aequorivita capsosiphonis TaxID=487317 RepID=UPI000423D7F2|nr:DUF6266 family protein [Aequorivita capsosiphonis]
MGKIPDGIFGGFSGRVGRVVGYNWRGEDMLRKAPRKRAKDSGTVKQLEQREKFALVIKFLTPIQEVVGAYFGNKYRSRSRFNLATSYNLINAVIAVPGGGFALDYSKVLLSKGGLRGMESGTIAAQPGSVLELNWTDNSGQGSAADDDLVLVVVYSATQELFQIFNPAALRSEATVQLNLPTYFSGEEVQVWGTMVSADRKAKAISSYMGTANVT